MRLAVASAAVVLLFLGTSLLPAPDIASLAGAVVAAQQQPDTAPPPAPTTPKVDINVHRDGGNWWMSPMWIAIGAIGLVVLILIVAMIARGGGGGTTIVRG